jgi:hypothetical protein
MPNTKSKMVLESIIICYWVIRIIYLPSPVTLSVRGVLEKKSGPTMIIVPTA